MGSPAEGSQGAANAVGSTGRDVYAALRRAFTKGLWAFWVRDDEIVAVAAPNLYTDAQGRLHREDGPAIEWESERYWFINGVHVTQRIVEQPETMSPESIPTQMNVEVRRIMLDRYGGLRGDDAMGKWLEDSKAKVVHHDEANGTLLKAELRGDEDLVMLRVRCPSTRRVYFLRVPPYFQCAVQARAWTFGMTREEFAPAVET